MVPDSVALLLIHWVIHFLVIMIILWISPFLVTEQQISEKLKNIMKENAELVQKLSSYEQKVLIILLAFSPWLQT